MDHIEGTRKTVCPNHYVLSLPRHGYSEGFKQQLHLFRVASFMVTQYTKLRQTEEVKLKDFMSDIIIH